MTTSAYRPNVGPTVMEMAMEAQKIFHRNADTLVAGYLIQHPDTDPADLMIVMQHGAMGKITLSLEPKEMHVPPPKFVPDPQFKGDVDEATYAAGWNDCRAAMIAKAKVYQEVDGQMQPINQEPDHG